MNLKIILKFWMNIEILKEFSNFEGIFKLMDFDIFIEFWNVEGISERILN